MDKVKAGIGTVLAALTAFWGWFGWLVVAWIVCMGIDFGTGVASALKRGVWSSAVSREGLWHKAGCVAAVAIAGILDLVMGQLLGSMPDDVLPFEYTVLLCPLVLTWYILTEAGSIIENAGEMGAPVPQWLRKMIAVLKAKVDTTVDENENMKDYNESKKSDNSGANKE